MTDNTERDALAEKIAPHVYDGSGGGLVAEAFEEVVYSIVDAVLAEREPVVVDDATEWEYAHAANGYWNEDETEFTTEEWLDVSDDPAGALARRRKAGPWAALTPDGQETKK
ncbi:hypothetical protein [Microbacterium sp. 1P06AB]|uniref:hypothetical protein n=1 Tax=Microbacterium sp. 1P06AB TaxID=3132289 RepID=UPI0039A784D3